MKTRFTPLFLILLFSLSCSNSTLRLEDDDYIVFGQFLGECVGESCIEIFRLEKTRLLEDTNDNYPSAMTFYSAKYTVLSTESFNKVKHITQSFPVELLARSSDKVIGQPDAGDWGGYYIEYGANGLKRFWLIDKMRSNTPEYLHSFLNEVDEAILELQ